MQDRPTYDELLAAVERFLDEEIVPNTQGSRGFHARVAANVLRIVRRELSSEDEQLAREWAGLDALLGAQERPSDRASFREALASRNGDLCDRIRAGDDALDDTAVVAHVRRAVRDKLLVSNPAWLGQG
jgi:hypothetical protein